MESKLLVEERTVVVPGEPVAQGMEYLPGNGTYRHEESILVSQIGTLQVDGKVLKIVPLAGKYMPNVGDIVIGSVVDILMSGWRAEINSPYAAVLPLAEASYDFIRKGADLTEYFDLGDQIVCKITQVTSQNLVDISMKSQGLRKLKGGQFLTVSSAKVPRLIGRKGSMVGLLKHATNCDVIVGQNGIVWISGGPAQEVIAARAVDMIVRKAHVSGLTEQVKAFLEKETGTTINLADIKEPEPQEEERRESRGPRGAQGGRDDRRGPPPQRDGERRPRGRMRGNDRRGGGERRPREDSFKE